MFNSADKNKAGVEKREVDPSRIVSVEEPSQATSPDRLISAEINTYSLKDIGRGALSADAMMKRIEELEVEVESERSKREFAETVARRAFEEVRQAIDHEPMTGLLTRGALYRRYDNWLGRVVDDGSDDLDNESLSPRRVVAYFVDIDDFKDVNTTFGHANGDIAIKVLASLMKSLNVSGLNTRLGGDECGAVRVMSGRAKDLRLAAEFRKEILSSIRDTKTGKLNESFLKNIFDKYEITGKAQDVVRGMLKGLSFSVGASSLPIADASGKDTIGSMLDKADKGMYGAKAHKVTRSLPRDD